MGASKVKNSPGMLPSDWVALFRKAGVLNEALDTSKSLKSRATLIGRFFAVNLDREVPIVVLGRPARARLRAVDAGQRQKKYFFEIRMDGDEPAGDAPTECPADRPAKSKTGATRRTGGRHRTRKPEK